MFKKVSMYVLALAMIIVQAQASAQSGLKAAFDELNYSLSVEWDQKDQAFFNQKSEAFTEELIRLQKAGVSNQQLLNELLSEIENKNLARDIQATFSLMSINALSQDEATRQIKSILEKNYQTGANWNGGSVLLGMVLVIAIIAVVGIVYQDQIKKEGERCYMAWKCNDYCGLTGCQQVCGEECI